MLCRRSDEEGLTRLVEGIRVEGNAATGFLLNAIEPGAIEDQIAEVEGRIGEIEVVVYNLGAQIGNRTLEATSLKAFERCWQLGCFGLFRTAQAVIPAMVERGRGMILVTSRRVVLAPADPALLPAVPPPWPGGACSASR